MGTRVVFSMSIIIIIVKVSDQDWPAVIVLCCRLETEPGPL